MENPPLIFPAIKLHGYCSPLVRGPTFAVSAAPHCGHPQDPRFAEALPEGGDLPSPVGASVMLQERTQWYTVVIRFSQILPKLPTTIKGKTLDLCKSWHCKSVQSSGMCFCATGIAPWCPMCSGDKTQGPHWSVLFPGNMLYTNW